MLVLLDIVAPVFVIIGAGYIARYMNWFSDVFADGLMRYTQSFAIPCLLYLAIARLDLAEVFQPGLLMSYYGACTISFVGMGLLARYAFDRRPGESVAVGFCCLFANSVLLGLPIMERAFGADALAPNYAIVAINAPFCYFLGITAMEVIRADGRSLPATALTVVKAMFSNALMIALALGFITNLTGQFPPDFVLDAAQLLASSALPAALFGLGGILVRYGVTSNLGELSIGLVISLLIRPAIAWVLATQVFDLPPLFTAAVVLTAAMPAGINAYVFANMYDRAKGKAAASVLLGTVIAVVSVSGWLLVIGPGG